MSDLGEYVALEVNGESVSLEDLLRLAKLRGLSKFIDEAAKIILIRQACTERGITISDEEFQRAADDFRLARDLNDVAATEEWLAANHLSFLEWESLLEHEILRQKLRRHETEGKIDQYFAEHRLSFDAAAISRLVLKDEDVARELRAQIVEEGADFHVLARQYSIDEASRPKGGYAGVINRNEMEAAVESAVFGSKPGKTVGPIKTTEGWELIRVESLNPATLDEPTREHIRSTLFDEWITQRRLKSRIRIPLFELKPEAIADEEVPAS
jgi:putative peptide maturation system protein